MHGNQKTSAELTLPRNSWFGVWWEPGYERLFDSRVQCELGKRNLVMRSVLILDFLPGQAQSALHILWT